MHLSRILALANFGRRQTQSKPTLKLTFSTRWKIWTNRFSESETSQVHSLEITTFNKLIKKNVTIRSFASSMLLIHLLLCLMHPTPFKGLFVLKWRTLIFGSTFTKVNYLLCFNLHSISALVSVCLQFSASQLPTWWWVIPLSKVW